jgi:hypothetical protein
MKMTNSINQTRSNGSAKMEHMTMHLAAATAPSCRISVKAPRVLALIIKMNSTKEMMAAAKMPCLDSV